MKLKVVLEPSDEGGFTVYVPSLPGCVSEGESETEALENIREAVELYLEPVDDDLPESEKRSGNCLSEFPSLSYDLIVKALQVWICGMLDDGEVTLLAERRPKVFAILSPPIGP